MYIVTLNAADKFTSNIETSLVPEVKMSTLPRLELPGFHVDISSHHSLRAVYNHSIGHLPMSNDEKTHPSILLS